jgi:hypothetical protein
MITQTIQAKQVTRTLRAIEQRDQYSLTLSELVLREKETGREIRLPRVAVKNLKSGACYSVVFRPAGTPQCNCPDGLRPAHQGTSLCCKHTILAIQEKERVEKEQAELEALNSDFALTEAEIEAMSEDLHLLTDAMGETAEEKKARVLADRRMWDAN